MSADQTKKQSERVSGVSNLAYDLISLMHNKLEGVAALETYKTDAQGNQEATALFDELQRTAVQEVGRIKSLLVQELGQ
jgi:hypothetical protein